MINFGIHVDTTSFEKKPVGGEIGGIRNRIDSNRCKDSYSPMCDIETLSKAIQNGCTFIPCHIVKMPDDAPEKYRFYSQQVIFIDIDNSEGKGKNSTPLPEPEYFTLNKIQATLKQHRITATIIYHSFSSKPDFQKFRVIIVLDEPITDRTERDKAVTALYQLFGKAADSSCRSIEKMFFGSYPDSVVACDETAITTKETLLQLHDELFKPELDVQQEMLDSTQSEDTYTPVIQPLNILSTPSTGRAMAWDDEIQAPDSQDNNSSSMHLGSINKNLSPDFYPDVLLDMIDPNKLDYNPDSEIGWIAVSSSYKFYSTGTQSYEHWTQWNERYTGNKERANRNTWNGLKGGCSDGTLKKCAQLHSPDKYFDYVQAMNPHSRKFADTSLKIGNSSMQAPIVGADSKQGEKSIDFTAEELKEAGVCIAQSGILLDATQIIHNDTINNIPLKELECHIITKTLKSGKTIEFKRYLPHFIYYVEPTKNKSGYYAISAECLAEFFQTFENYFFVSDHAFDSVRRYWYDKEKGVYKLVSESIIKAMLAEHVNYWEKTVHQKLVKTKDINEAYTLLTWDNTRTKPESVLDSDEITINFKNGLYDLKTGQFTEHSPLNFSTIQLDANYIPFTNAPDLKEKLAEECPIFMNYLNTLAGENPDKIQLLLEFAGACLSNVHGYRYKKALFLVGEGNTGKSQYIRLLCELLGDSNCAAVSFPELDDRFQSGATYGKRLVVDADMKLMRAKSNHNFMMYTGGDPRQVEFKGLNPFTAVYNGFLLFAANELPKFGGNTTDAAYNRMMILYCNNVIPEDKQDPELLQKMLAERQAIVPLALYYFMQTIPKKYKFTIPAECSTALTDMKKANSPSIEFYTSCCEWLPDSDTNIKSCYKCSNMYSLFADWCKATQNHGYTPSAKEFKKEIMQFLHIIDDKQIIKKNPAGIRYYKFQPTKETLNEFRAGSISVCE